MKLYNAGAIAAYFIMRQNGYFTGASITGPELLMILGIILTVSIVVSLVIAAVVDKAEAKRKKRKRK